MDSSQFRSQPTGSAHSFTDSPLEAVDIEDDTYTCLFSEDEPPYPPSISSYSAPYESAFASSGASHSSTTSYNSHDEVNLLSHPENLYPENLNATHSTEELFSLENHVPYHLLDRLDGVNESRPLRPPEDPYAVGEDFVSLPAQRQPYLEAPERINAYPNRLYSSPSDGIFSDDEEHYSYGTSNGSISPNSGAQPPFMGPTSNNKSSSSVPRPFALDNQDRLTTNIPLKPKVNHIPVLSNRGAGLQWRQPVKTPKPQGIEIPLFNGNLVMDVPVPFRLLRQVAHSERDEFSHTRYTAVTCDPSQFSDERYTLRPTLFASPRVTEVMIVLTMYNEDDILFAKTLRSVLANISDIGSSKNDRWGGKASWKNVVVCLVSDGRSKVHPRTLALLTLLGVYQDGIAKSRVNGKEVTAHLYEYTTQMRVQIKKGVVKVVHSSAAPCQILFCLKEKNQKKVNSHRWALQAFGRVLNPSVCVFIDVGTEPQPGSILHLLNAFDQHPSCGSVSGVTKVLVTPKNDIFSNPLVAAQNFEYKMWNILDRPFDSLFGLRFDMPGAMLAYRYIALQNDKQGEGPLNDYFAIESNYSDGVFSKNMSLTEERGLSFALITKRNCSWDLRFEYLASATIDVPEILSEYVFQRRRWLNGTFFGSIYAIINIHLIFRSGHEARRKLLLFMQCIYQAVALLFSWFSIGNLFLIFHILVATLATEISSVGLGGGFIVKFFDFLYAGTLFLSFVFALGHSPRDRTFLFVLVLVWSSIMFLLITIIAILTLISVRTSFNIRESSLDPRLGNILTSLIFPLSTIYSAWFVVAVVSGSPGFLFTSIAQYILLLPTRINIVNLYAFCNIHDVTWGTKGDDFAKLPSVSNFGSGGFINIPTDDNGTDKMYLDAAQLLKTKAQNDSPSLLGYENDQFMINQRVRTLVMAPWALSNVVLVFVVLHLLGPGTDLQKNMAFVSHVLIWFVSLTGVKCAGALYYFFAQWKQERAQKVDLTRKKKDR